MAVEKSAFVNSDVVDDLMRQTAAAEVAAFYGHAWPSDHKGSEARIACPIAGCEPSSYGKLTVNVADPVAKIYCHSCGVRGNILTLMWIMKHHRAPAGGRLRGEEFKEMVADLQAIRGRQTPLPATSPPPVAPSAPERPAPNIPLARSENEQARLLTQLDDEGTLDESQMSPAAARYLRRRPYLTESLCKKWGVTYLPPKARSTLRGRFVYPVESIRSERLAWVGRDPSFEEKYEHWVKDGKRVGQEPIKYRFPQEQFFRRALQLFGEQAKRLAEPGYREMIARHGIIVVEGFNDVLRFDAAGIPAVGVMSNRLTEWQIEKLVQFSRQIAGGRICVCFDRDEKGIEGSKEALYALAKHGPVLDAWGTAAYSAVEPEGLSTEECKELCRSLANRWSA